MVLGEDEVDMLGSGDTCSTNCFGNVFVYTGCWFNGNCPEMLKHLEFPFWTGWPRSVTVCVDCSSGSEFRTIPLGRVFVVCFLCCQTTARKTPATSDGMGSWQ